MNGNRKIEGVQEMSFSDLARVLAANNKMNLSELAKASGRSQSVLSIYMKRENLKVSALIEILGGVGEDLIILLSNGQKIKISEGT